MLVEGASGPEIFAEFKCEILELVIISDNKTGIWGHFYKYGLTAIIHTLNSAAV